MEQFSEVCLCGRSFSQVYAFANHKCTCQKSKKRLSSALAKAKDLWVARKKTRLEPCDDETPLVPASQQSMETGADIEEVRRSFTFHALGANEST
jgi:hypothetical protein